LQEISSANLVNAMFWPVGGRSIIFLNLMGMVMPVCISLNVKLEDIIIMEQSIVHEISLY
jgi:hypothetical protein